ncbi:ATP-binding protein [Rhizobium sp. YIM 134829]|uniref:ATP-binding protein n=1 Tax=Rhizobium sp. YIM 134829 TaxID=3390453 RepID=UPI00397BD4FD
MPMLSLRTRFTGLLVAAVLFVMVTAAFVTATILAKPPEALFDLAMAEKAEMARLLLDSDPTAATRLAIPIRATPPSVVIDRELTDRVQRQAEARGYSVDLLIARSGRTMGRDLAIQLKDGRWALLGNPGRAAFPLKPLTAYLTLVALGVLGVAIYASAVMLRPLRLLEDTTAAISADGKIPRIEETGPIEVRTTAQTINRLAARLNAAISSRMRLVAAAGHDMRTPLTRMRLRAEFVGDAEERALWLKDLEELDQIADSAIRLLREEMGPGLRETIALDPLLEDVVNELVEIGLPVRLGQVDTVELTASPFALKRALRNLIVNAATHGGGAEVSLEARDEEAVLSIVDEGPGIPEHLLGRVFEPFFRVDGARRKLLPGAGLGLAIAREIIGNQFGSVSIANRPGGGLQQTVRLRRTTKAA